MCQSAGSRVYGCNPAQPYLLHLIETDKVKTTMPLTHFDP